MAVIVLTVELLEELEDRWRAQRAPIAERLNAGLPLERMQELVAPLGITLPVEVHLWWGWHNGVSLESNDLAVLRKIGPGHQFLPLEDAVRDCWTLRDMAKKNEPEAPE